MFMRPRVSEEPRRRGCAASPAFDILTGKDLSTPKGRSELWRRIAADGPLVIIMSPVCKAFSIARVPFWDTMDPEEQRGLEYMQLCALIAQYQLQRG
eukprot:6702080-Pyramimonas_sp.AAC.1